MTAGDWKELFKSDFEKKRSDGSFSKHGEMTKLTKEYADTFKLPLGTVKTYYYKLVREEGKLKDQQANEKQSPAANVPDNTNETKSKEVQDNNLDESINKAARLPAKTLRTPETRPSRPPYKHGDEIEVETIDIVDYGIFVKTNDGYRYDGLIHVSEIKPGSFLDSTELKKMFEVGGIFKTKFKMAKPHGKLELTMRGMPLPERNDPLPVDYKGEPFKNNVLEEKLMGKSIVESGNDKTAVANNELEAAAGFVQELLGAPLSDGAKAKVVELAQSLGMFKLGMFMNQVAADFQPVDLGVLFLDQVRAKANGGL